MYFIKYVLFLIQQKGEINQLNNKMSFNEMT